MTDPAFSLLQPYLQDTSTLWIADENALTATTRIHNSTAPQVLTNRFDVYQELMRAGINTQFNDFASNSFAPASLERIVYRVSKEKPVVHRVINLALQWLKADGELILCGLKNEGTKTFIEKAAALFNNNVRAEKHGQVYFSRLRKLVSAETVSSPLDDSDYAALRLIHTRDSEPTLNLYSKPGVFGWNKIDRGSELLVEQLDTWLPRNITELSLLDLGCGYGYLSMMASYFHPAQQTATDNNAAALLCMAHNAKQADISIDVIAADCGDSINTRYDIVLCNPPFHQGFSVDSSLTDKFLRQTRRLLKPQGKALYVVNQFIGLEKKAQPLFKQVGVLCQQDGFKIIELS